MLISDVEDCDAWVALRFVLLSTQPPRVGQQYFVSVPA